MIEKFENEKENEKENENEEHDPNHTHLDNMAHEGRS